MSLPAAPDKETREQLLDVIGEYVSRGGAERFLLSPVVPGAQAFPEPWAPTKAGVTLLLRRLAWHAGIDRAILLDDQRTEGAPPTERKPATRVELVEIRTMEAVFALGFVGTDDVVGTVAHEIGVMFAALHRPDDKDPYRTAEQPVIAVDPDLDLARGSIAAVYLGLGVLAANAAYQQYSRAGRFNGGYVPHEYDVLRAGYMPMSGIAFLLAVQATARGDAGPPAGLEPPQRDEVAAWMAALPSQSALRERLGITADISAPARAVAMRFADVALEAEPAPNKIAFRWQTHRGGIGMIAGTVIGVGFAVLLSRGMAPYFVFGGAGGGHAIGRRMRRPRCSGCATIVAQGATACSHCGAALRGDIASLADRLDAEEQLGEDDRDARPGV